MSFPRQPQLPNRKVHIQTFGCQMNEYDTDKMLEVLRHQNYSSTQDSEEADLILLNTCSVREKAEHKVYSLLGRLRQLKQKNPSLVIGVGGCVAQQEGINILKRAPGVDLVFGTDNLFDLPEMLVKVQRGERVVQTERKAHKQKVRNFIPEYTFGQGIPGIKAHISITKGCNNFCTFCIVPITRGLEVSREPDDILEEAKQLVFTGTKEILLLGQNVNSYQAQGVDFVELLTRLDGIEGLERLRFISPHPKDLNESLAKAFRDLPSLCEHMHLPLQAGSNEVLKRMRRHYTLEEYLEKVDLLRGYVPDIALSTDLIMGFPGETEKDFQKTIEALEAIRYDQLYAFKYSPRPGTPAATYEDQLEDSVKVDRLRVVLETHERFQSEKCRQLIGTDQEVLIEGVHPKEQKSHLGRTRRNYSVMIQNCDAKPGDVLNVRIMETKQHSLIAEPCHS